MLFIESAIDIITDSPICKKGPPEAMKDTQKIEGIIVRAYESGDSDLVLHIVSPVRGKFSAIAKSAKKQKKNFGNRYDIFDHGIFELSAVNHGLPVVRSFTNIKVLASLRTNLDKLALASVLAEAVDLLLKEESEHDASVFEAFQLGLQAIEEEKLLNDLLKSSFFSLSHILLNVGISPINSSDKPSPKMLMELIAHIEDFSERRMKTRPMLEEILRQYAKGNRSQGVKSV